MKPSILAERPLLYIEAKKVSKRLQPQRLEILFDRLHKTCKRKEAQNAIEQLVEKLTAYCNSLVGLFIQAIDLLSERLNRASDALFSTL